MSTSTCVLCGAVRWSLSSELLSSSSVFSWLYMLVVHTNWATAVLLRHACAVIVVSQPLGRFAVFLLASQSLVSWSLDLSVSCSLDLSVRPSLSVYHGQSFSSLGSQVRSAPGTHRTNHAAAARLRTQAISKGSAYRANTATHSSTQPFGQPLRDCVHVWCVHISEECLLRAHLHCVDTAAVAS